MGWLPGSSMTRTYVHLSGRDTDEAILRAHGILPEEEPQTKTGPRCTAANAAGSGRLDHRRRW